MNLFLIANMPANLKESNDNPSFKINFDILDELDKIVKEEMDKIHYALSKRLNQVELEEVKQRALDLVDFNLKEFCAYRNSYITNVDKFTINKYEQIDNKTISLSGSVRKDIPLKLSNLEKTINEWILDDLRTAVIYTIFGEINRKGDKKDGKR